MVSVEVLSELAPFVTLSEKLGRLAVQLVAGQSGIQSVKVNYTSARVPNDLNTRLLRVMITKGLLEPISCVKQERGLRITEELILLDGSPENPLEFIQVQIANVESKFATTIFDLGEIRLEGKVTDGKPYLTKLGSFGVVASMEGGLILCRQVDQPGMVGSMGNILGEENVVLVS